MKSELKLPDLGENIDSGTVVRVLVAVGDKVVMEQPLLELETGKATIEVPSSAEGVVAAVLMHEGDTLQVGQVFLVMEEDGSVLQPASAVAIAESAEPPPPAPEPVLESARTPSTVVPITRAPQPTPTPPPLGAPAGTLAVAAPHVRQFAREIGVSVDEVVGSGPGGRVSNEDVKRHAREARPKLGAAPAGPRAVPALPDFSAFGPVDREALSTVRQRIAEQMSTCWENIPHVVLQAKADATELEAFRKRYKERAESSGGKLTLTAIILKVVASALRAHPRANASLDMERRELVLKRFINIGIATDTPRGLLVPVLKDADRKSLVQLGAELAELTDRARAGKLAPAEMQGATFSITNLGSLGIGHFSAIINHPEVAILAVGKAEMQPVWNGKEFAPRLMLPLTLNVDHRLLDGADGARFLSWIVQAIEQPLLIAL